MKTSVDIPADLMFIQEHSWKPSGLTCTNILANAESQEYSAYSLDLDGMPVAFRIAKITPTKVWQFVTFWKRSLAGPIVPYHEDDDIHAFIVIVRDGDHIGQFMFPRSILLKKWILSQVGKLGKLAFRVYPPWDITDNPQAKRTQKWQLEYFVKIDTSKTISEENKEKVKKLLSK